MEFSENLKRCLNETSQAIGPDVYSSWEQGFMSGYDAETVAEIVMDADHMSTYCGEDGVAAQAEMREFFKSHGFPATVAEAAKYVAIA